jgi:cytochrome c-type biogenesis protein CcmE
MKSIMSAIDDELEQAVLSGEALSGKAEASPGDARGSSPGESGSSADVPPTSGEPLDAAPAASGGRWGLLLGLLALMGLVLALVFSSEDEAVVYAYGVDEVKAKAGELGERRVRMQGNLVSGTLVRRDDPCEYRFQLQKADARMEVHYKQCVVPDNFRDVEGVAVEVTAEGRLAAAGHLEATHIFAKCPSKYEMRESAGEMGARPSHAEGQPQPRIIPPREIADIN